MKVNIIRITENPIDAIASAFAITRGLSYEEYKAKYDRDKALGLIRDCYDAGHMSGFEFVDIDLEILGCSRVFEVDRVRSRLASYEVEAGAFTDARDFETVVPKGYTLDEVARRLAVIREWNQKDKEKGIDPRSRRYWTHQGIARRMRSKQNFRALIETGWNRFCGKAQWEYREFMQLTLEALEQTELEPLCDLLVPKCVHLGYCNEKESCVVGGF